MRPIRAGFSALLIISTMIVGSSTIANATASSVTINSPATPTLYSGGDTVNVDFTWTTSHLGCNYHAVITIGPAATPIAQQTFTYPSCDGNVNSHNRTESLTLPAATPDGSYDLKVRVNEFQPNSFCCGAEATLTGVIVVDSVPDSVADCKNGGWSTQRDSAGKSFRNQGDCVSFVATGGSNLAAV